jgi:phage shock protein A
MAPSSDALCEIARALQTSIEEVDRRAAAWAECAQAPPRAAPYAERFREAAARRQTLTARTEAIARQMAVADEEINRCETQLRELAERTETLRRRLATWTGRAIG